MKKIITLFLVAATLFSILTIGSGAVGTCLFYDDFSYGFSPANWMLRGGYDACAFIWDSENQYLYGMDDAIALQSNYVDSDKKWSDYCISMDVRVQEGGLGESDTSNVILQFQDLFETGVQNAPVYSYSIVLQTGEAFLVKEFSYTNQYGNEEYSWVAMDKELVPDYIQIHPNATWFNIAMRVTKGKIQCYFNGELLLESTYDKNDTKLGRFNQNTPDSTVGTQKYPLVFINYNNVLNVDNVQVWTGDYDFTTLAGDVNGDGKVNVSDASRLLQRIAGWKSATVDIHQTDLNGDGNSNLSDATVLLKYIAGWDVELG